MAGHKVQRDFQATGSSLVPEIISTAVLSIFFATTLTAARIAVKLRLSKLQVEDYFAIVAWAALVSFDSLILSQIKYGFGRHVTSISPQDDETQLRYYWVNSFLWNPVMAICKTTLSLQFYRIFCPTSRGAMFIANTALMCFNLVWLTIFFFVLLFQCVPQHNVWTMSMSNDCHISPTHEYIGSASFNALADILLFVLPVWAIWHLKMRLKQKLRIIAIFSVGVLACTCSLIRLGYSVVLDKGSPTGFDAIRTVMWTIAELTAIVIVTCFPLMPLFWRTFIKVERVDELKESEKPIESLQTLAEVVDPDAPRRHDVEHSNSVPQLSTMNLTKPELSVTSSQ